MNDSILRFNGERSDPVSGNCWLGNGYRVCNSTLMRFNCRDSLSPFEAGGIHPYAYCAGDPINRADPSGHFSLGQRIGFGLGLAAGMVLGMVTEGAAIPVVLTLVANTAGGTAIGAGTELVTEYIDRQPVDWHQVEVSATEYGLAELLGTAMSKGLGRAYRTIRKSLSGAPKSRVYDENIIPLGGTRTLHGINADFGYHAFTDTYANKPRFTVVGHGGYDSANNLGFGKHYLSAATLAGHLKQVMPEDIRYVRLAMCCSADKGPLSFAQALANELKLPVKGFHGQVGMKTPFIGSLYKLKGLETSPTDFLAWKAEIVASSGLPFLEKIKFNYAPEWFNPQYIERSWHGPTDFMRHDMKVVL